MKKIGWLGIAAVLAIIVIAAVMASQMGETTHAFAKGKVLLDDAVAAQAADVDTLFLIMSGPDRPMPLGALKKTIAGEKKGELYDFVLTTDNMQMMGGGEVPDTFKIKARLDRDGVAGPDQPGDLVGEVMLVKRGQDGVEVRINRVVQ